jgi:HD superfamily phosphohydrolase
MNRNDEQIATKLAGDFQALTPDLQKIEAKFAGGSGFIFRLEYKNGEERGLKVFRPDQISQLELLQGFLREGDRLSQMVHPRIVRAFKVSSATFKSVGAELPYYIMEWVHYSSLDVALQEGLKPSLPFITVILRQILDALQYLHHLTPPLCHLDVKEANLLIDNSNPTSPQIKLADFGLAKEVSKEHELTEVRGSLYYWPREWQERLQGMIPTNNNRAYIVLPRNEIPITVDLHMLAVTLQRLLSRVESRQPSEYGYRALALLAERMNWEEDRFTTVSEKYKTASAVLADLEKVDRSFSLPQPLTDMGMIRAPVNSFAGFGDAARSIVDLPWFQRLRGVRELGITHLVYPGAVHTRFEHSLGTFAQAVEYLRALMSNQNSPWFLIYLNDEEIKAIALTALLHDLGHYPFAHQLEDLANWREHEKLGYDILSGEITESFPALTHAFGSAETLLDTVEKKWRIDRSLMLEMFSYCYRDKLTNAPSDAPRSWRVAAEIINGPIDADKLDYIRRDAQHCGVSYGLMSDPIRFLSSLTVAFDQGRTHLAVTEKGRVDAEFIAVIRYAMFSEVYWHHTVRSLTTMLRRAFYEAARWQEGELTIEELLRSSDDKVLDDLQSRATGQGHQDVRELLARIRTRAPYPRLFTLRESTYPDLYRKLMKDRLGFMQGKKWKIEQELCQKVFGIKGLKKHQVLWDIPKPGKDTLSDVRIAEFDGKMSAKTPGPLWDSLAGNFAQWVRRIRLFIDRESCPARTIVLEKEPKFRQELATLLKI